MSATVLVTQALQLDRQILKQEAELKQYLKDAQAKPTYGNVLRYVKTNANSGSRIALIVLTPETHLAYKDELVKVAQGLRRVGFEVKLTSRILSVTIPNKGL
jgi:hypothetical protein